ncbi:MAG TPA: glycosyltransferase family 87 protein [Gaiellaceae bacterium]|nr:glycosyltransferase family 87 protein [Gaiellaceae bacterium]
MALGSVLVATELVRERASIDRYGEDFVPAFWQPWLALRADSNPYPDPGAPLLDGSPFLYPPLSVEVTLPLSWLTFDQAFAVFAAVLVVASALTLWALEISHPALWVIWMSNVIVVETVALGNASLLVILGVALAWRWRDRPGPAAAALTAALVVKLFVLPVLLWFLFTRRYRAAVYTIAASTTLVIGSWVVIGFDGLVDYPELLATTSEELGPNGLLAYALAVKSVSHEVAAAIGLAAAGALLAGAFARRRDDRASMTLALLASLYATPVMWVHYLGLLIVPAALYGGWVWATIPLTTLWLLAPTGVPRPGWLITCFIVMTAAVTARAFVQGASRTSRPTTNGPRLVEYPPPTSSA